MDNTQIVKRFYDENVESEWERLERHPVEFEITKRYLARYIKPGDEVLDMGGGPGRYSLFLSEMGCDVTLADLSPGNVAFARQKAREAGLNVRAFCMDAREPSALASEAFDHILLFGPLYHLTDEEDRVKAVRACMDMLKHGGTLFAAFISSFAVTWDFLSRIPECIIEKDIQESLSLLTEDKSFSGLTFTESHLVRPGDVERFMQQFGLKKLHIMSAEGFLSLRERELTALPAEVINAWINIAEKVCEREDLLSMAMHFVYIGKKPARGI